ncbi:MAG: hypothetical protein QW035_00075 [Candidatus Anstonellales archaeon]
MDIPAGVLFGAASMLSWGTADFIAARAICSIGPFPVLLWSQLLGAILFLLGFALFSSLPMLSAHEFILFILS